MVSLAICALAIVLGLIGMRSARRWVTEGGTNAVVSLRFFQVLTVIGALSMLIVGLAIMFGEHQPF